MTQLIHASKNYLTPQMKAVCKHEHIDPNTFLERIADGTIVIPYNKARPQRIKPIGIGKGLRTKINANLGTSEDHCDPQEEIDKLNAAVKAGADAVMDLSTGGEIDTIRQTLIEHSPVPLGTVPIYQSVVELLRAGKDIEDLSETRLLKTIEQHGKEGVDFITVHCGLTMRAVKKMERHTRIMNVVSRGGAFLVKWMRSHGKENPLFSGYDRILEIAKEFDMTLSLGDGLRPGAIHDATDSIQIDELVVISELRDRAVDAGVQVMIEGPGHVPLGQVKTNMQLEKTLCKNAPFYVLGPLVTDVAPGYDHIVSAIGGAVAAAAGADFLCYVTPSEHLRLPDIEDVRMGVIASKIAAHVGDIEKGVYGAQEWDDDMSRARASRDWNKMLDLALEPERPRAYRKDSPATADDVCTMCGKFCSIKTAEIKK